MSGSVQSEKAVRVGASADYGGKDGNAPSGDPKLTERRHHHTGGHVK